MSKISRETLLNMSQEVGCYRKECGFTECDFDAMEQFAELVLASQHQQAKPVAWQFFQDGKWCNGSNDIKGHRKNTENAGIPTRDLYPPPAVATVKEGHNDLKPYVFEAAEALLRELSPAVAIPTGYALAPVEPTDEMLGAGLRHVKGRASMPAAYRAMLAKAPQPPVVSADELVAAEREACLERCEGVKLRADCLAEHGLL